MNVTSAGGYADVSEDDEDQNSQATEHLLRSFALQTIQTFKETRSPCLRSKPTWMGTSWRAT